MRDAILSLLQTLIRHFRNFSQEAVRVELDWLKEDERVLLDTAGVLADGFLRYGVRITLTNLRLTVRSSMPSSWGYGEGIDDKSFEIPIERLHLISFRKADLQWLAGGRRGEVVVADERKGEHKLQLRDAATLTEHIRTLTR